MVPRVSGQTNKTIELNGDYRTMRPLSRRHNRHAAAQKSARAGGPASCASGQSNLLASPGMRSGPILRQPNIYATWGSHSVPSGDRDSRSRRNPLIVRLHVQPELVVVDAQVAVLVADDCRRHDRLYFLRKDADIGFVAAIVAEPVEAEAIVEMTEEDDVMLEPDIGSTTAAASSAAATTTATGAHSSAAASTAAHSHGARTSASSLSAP